VQWLIAVGMACFELLSHFADELSTESVDDTCHGWSLSLADEVEIQHSLYSLWLQTTLDKMLDFVHF
jgi:hypothetical protein